MSESNGYEQRQGTPGITGAHHSSSLDSDGSKRLDGLSIEEVLEAKISRFFDQLNGFYPEDLYNLFLHKLEKPLLVQLLKRVGGNQVHAARILGLNRNTLRKKMRLHGLL